ncbi:SAGA HAT/Core module component [Arachnomyces sp. PD_36]|nr:SAGA HAT/Core module component [Arachnomyces sp. PD_36]
MSNHDVRSGNQSQIHGSPPPEPRETLGETPETDLLNSGDSSSLSSLIRKSDRSVRETDDSVPASSIQTGPLIPSAPRLSSSSLIGDDIKADSPSRNTRRNKPKLQKGRFAWAAHGVEEQKPSKATGKLQNHTSLPEQGSGNSSTVDKEADLSIDSDHTSTSMSRNRPRGAQNRDNGLAANEEIDMWNGITRDLQKAQEKNDKQRVLGLQIKALNEKISREGNKPSLSEIDQLDSLHRQLLKLSEEEKAILREEPTDVIKNLGILIALRSATEADPHSRAPSVPKSRKRKNDHESSAADSPGPATTAVSEKLNRIKGSTQRSASVSSMQAREARESVSVKIEEGSEGAKGTAAERSGQFVIGAEVVFKHNKKQHGVEGEGIQCIIKNISGEGSKKRYAMLTLIHTIEILTCVIARYDVQDPEPNENGEQGAVYKTTAASLIPIPQVGSTLPFFAPGKQVLARYPDTTTFYRAEVMGSKKDVYRLKFEGEEDDKEMDVVRRFVLDIPGK